MARTREDPRWRVPSIVHTIESSKTPLVVVDGIRSREEAEELRGRYGSRFLLLEVRVPDKLREERATNRGRPIDHNHQDAAAHAAWLRMDKEEVAMIRRIRPMVDVVVDGRGEYEG